MKEDGFWSPIYVVFFSTNYNWVLVVSKTVDNEQTKVALIGIPLLSTREHITIPAILKKKKRNYNENAR